MALGDAYLTVAEFKARTRSTVSANDAAIEAVLEAASRQVDGWCGREFNKSAAEESRVFDWHGICRYSRHPVTFVDEWPRGSGEPYVQVGDLVSVSSIAAGDGSGAYPFVWDTDSYVLTPRNAAAKGWPYTEVASVPGGPHWSVSFHPIQVTGIFGWPAVPAPVVEATFLNANRLKSLWDAPFGQSGGGEMGALDMTTSITPLIAAMLAPYQVRTV